MPHPTRAFQELRAWSHSIGLAALLAQALLSSGCVTANQSFQPIGRVDAHRIGSAAYDQNSVRGPKVSVSRCEDGDWGGWLGGPVRVTIRGNRMVGMNTNLYMDFNDQGPVVHGMWKGHLVWLQLGHQLTLHSNYWLNLSGTAAWRHPPFPQFAFALLGALQ